MAQVSPVGFVENIGPKVPTVMMIQEDLQKKNFVGQILGRGVGIVVSLVGIVVSF